MRLTDYFTHFFDFKIIPMAAQQWLDANEIKLNASFKRSILRCHSLDKFTEKFQEDASVIIKTIPKILYIF